MNIFIHTHNENKWEAKVHCFSLSLRLSLLFFLIWIKIIALVDFIMDMKLFVFIYEQEIGLVMSICYFKMINCFGCFSPLSSRRTLLLHFGKLKLVGRRRENRRAREKSIEHGKLI